MSITDKLRAAVHAGLRRIGEIEIRTFDSTGRFAICHHADTYLSREPGCGGLEICDGPDEARRLSLYAPDGSYRFLKAQRNLRRGWVMRLESAADLRLALDHFYPAALGVWLAWREGRLEVEQLRAKLDRQTGMYRRAKLVSDEAAVKLVETTCEAEPVCARRILWSLAADQPLSPPACCTGVAPGVPEAEAIPLLCAAPCNHFITQCLAAAKSPQTTTTP
jgi:hypothetical protein